MAGARAADGLTRLKTDMPLAAATAAPAIGCGGCQSSAFVPVSGTGAPPIRSSETTMTNLIQTLAAKALLAAALGLGALGAGPALAQDIRAGELKITTPWARATPGGARVAGGFLEIENTGKEPDALIGGTLAVADEVEIHEMAMEGNVMRMRRLGDGLEIKPGAKVVLKPGGYHVMFMGLKKPLVAGETVKGTLEFKRAGVVEVAFKVAPIGAAGPGGGHGGGHGMKH
jgi:hypothetical protein